jgi:hypothetical protein
MEEAAVVLTFASLADFKCGGWFSSRPGFSSGSEFALLSMEHHPDFINQAYI